MGIGKNIIRVLGLIFLLWGTLYAVNFLLTGEFLWTPMEMTYRIGEKAYNILAPIFIFVLWVIGINLIRLKDTARQWGLVILWLYFISYLINLIFLTFSSIIVAGSFLKDISIDIDPIILNGAVYGFERNIEVSEPNILIAILVVINIILGAQIAILSSKKNRNYFVVEQ